MGQDACSRERICSHSPELVGNKQKASLNIQPSKYPNISGTISEAGLYSVFHKALLTSCKSGTKRSEDQHLETERDVCNPFLNMLLSFPTNCMSLIHKPSSFHEH